jgi:hypothetical protein
VAALITSETGLDVELVVGGRGEFTVWVDDERVANKDATDQDAVSAVRRATDTA